MLNVPQDLWFVHFIAEPGSDGINPDRSSSLHPAASSPVRFSAALLPHFQTLNRVALLRLAWAGRIATDDLDFLRSELVSAFTFELHILHEESPYIVTEAVCF